MISKLLLRLDASNMIGLGHLVRTMALVEQLKQINQNLVVDLATVDWQPRLNNSSNAIINHRINLASCHDIKTIIQHNQQWDVLIVDHYQLSAVWEKQLRSFCKMIVVIDDLANRSHDCDLLVDQNLYSDNLRYRNLIPTDSKQLLGPNFALLRSEINQYKMNSPSEKNRVFLFLGGGDNTIALQKILIACRADFFRNYFFDIVITDAYTHEHIRSLCQGSNHFHLHVNPSSILSLMQKSSLAIGAGGSTTWERFYFGMACILLSTAPNQIEGSKYLAQIGAIVYLGNIDEIDIAAMSQKFECIFKDQKRLSTMRRLCKTLVDGQGTSRVAGEIMNVYESKN